MKTKLINTLYSLSLLLFITAFGFQHNPPSGWQQQFMPDLGGRTIVDITFTDSLNGYAITSKVSDSSYILRTINGGEDWFIARADSGAFYNKIQFINQNTGFVGGLNRINTSYFNILKTTNAGANWFFINAPFSISVTDMSVLNEDTIWFVSSNSLAGGVFRTTDGGISWAQQFSGGTHNPEKIYMFNSRMGFIARNIFPPVNDRFYKTTNGGLNWFSVNNDGFRNMYFVDSLTGWKSTSLEDSSMKKTTDGGIIWTIQPMPSGGIIRSNTLTRFNVISEDTVYGIGGYVRYPNNRERGIIYRTIDGGDNWHYQIPDTNINIVSYNFIKFINGKTGWVYANYQPPAGIHTATGGDTNWIITNIKQTSHEIPNSFKIFQNYPNPFNPATTISYQLSRSGNVRLTIYDITGKLVKELINEQQASGTYQYNFNAEGLASGIYFYTMYVKYKEEHYTETKKMLLVR